jgi:preprotein translocase subunit SecF
MNIIGKKYWFFGLSLLIIIPGLVAIASGGLKPSVDFTGGTLLELHFSSGTAPDPALIRQALQDLQDPVTGDPLGSITIRTIGTDGVDISFEELNQDTITLITNTLDQAFGLDREKSKSENVGAAVGIEVTRRAAGAVLLAALGIALYVWYAFRRLLGLEAVLGLLLGWKADSLFLTAILTVIGFSVHDTIVVFDRIRENQIKYRSSPFEQVVNHSIVQTLDRSINTTLTVLLTLFALALFGGETTRHFIIILLIGMASGAYSSIFNAAAILVVWENREWTKWFTRKKRMAPAKS